MSTPICGFRAIDGTYWPMKPDCDRRNADIYAGLLPANLERGVASNIEATGNYVIYTGPISGEPDERLWFLGWMFACAAAGLATGTVVGVIINQLW